MRSSWLPGLQKSSHLRSCCKKYDFGWFIASFWVGDGAMCLFDAENKTAKLLGTPDEGEFSGQTRFLTIT